MQRPYTLAYTTFIFADGFIFYIGDGKRAKTRLSSPILDPVFPQILILFMISGRQPLVSVLFPSL